MDIFRDDEDRRAFLYRLSEAVERFEIECWHYCLMSNHYHLLMFPRRPNVPDVFQYLNGAYAHRFNKRWGQTGHVFEAPYKEQIVQEEGYLRNVCRYISQNPVRANMVKAASDWQWSGHRALSGEAKEPAFLTTDRVLGAFGGGDERNARSRFATFIQGPGEDDAWIEDRIRSNERCLGDRAFKVELGIIDRRDTDAATFAAGAASSGAARQPLA